MMRIGLTYDLRDDYLAAGYSEEETAELDQDDTIVALETAIARLGHQPERIGRAQRLIERLAVGDRWDLVFNIAEGIWGAARESQVPAILDIHRIPYTFSDPLVLALCLDKRLTKLVVRAAGIATAEFALVERPEDVASVRLPFPLFAKPVAEGTSKGVTPASKIADSAALAIVCRELLEKFGQGVLVETWLPGREFTVGLVGTGERARVIGTLEILLRPEADAEIYSFTNKEHYDRLVEYVLRSAADPQVRQAEELGLRAWRALGCRDAGRVDLRCDAAGRLNFIEVNPLAGMHPLRSDLPILCRQVGMTYDDLIQQILESAAERITASTPGVVQPGAGYPQSGDGVVRCRDASGSAS
jgi:D-alanine-D-alanine ligase